MAVKPSQTYVDTSVSGLVIIVEHNLGGTPDIFITELDAGRHKYVSLYDPRISEIKTLDENSVQLTFASTFAGYIHLNVIEADIPSVQERIAKLEDRYLKLLALIEDKVSSTQWDQINTLTQSQIKSISSQASTLRTDLELLKTDVAAL